MADIYERVDFDVDPNKSVNVAAKNVGLIELITWPWPRFRALQSAILVLYFYHLNEKRKD